MGLKQRQNFQRRRAGGSKNGVSERTPASIPMATTRDSSATMVDWGMTPMQAIQAATANASAGAGPHPAMSAQSRSGATETWSALRVIRSLT
jgi:hypothetical protein